ncbi:hypothetical protein B0H21DRAFT_781149 [Amylocystis lapponica]|nr:hypothetical protein B0H21DRAFT_781149 [Amylocystis lapponica]
MEVKIGPGRGSYIWGRSVHNIRIKRSKWKKLFQALEASCGLDVDNPAHIWLLHHLFLHILNQEIIQWAQAWNSHRIQVPGLGHRSPEDMHHFSILEQGPRGQPADIDVDNPDEYDIDWDTLENATYHAHHQEYNNPDILQQNPFLTHQPEEFHVVDVEIAQSPLTDIQIEQLNQYLVHIPSACTHTQIWCHALTFCTQIASS